MKGPTFGFATFSAWVSPAMCLVLLWLFHALNNVVWLRLDQTLPINDQAFNPLGGLRYLELLKDVSWGRLGELATFANRAHPSYPPVNYLAKGLLHLAAGPSLAVSRLANLPFLALLLWSVYRIGAKVSGRAMGLFAAFLVSMYPFVFGLSRSAQPDFALTAMVAFSVYCLLLTDGFTKRWPSVGFGVSVGLGMLTKEMFVVFLLPAFVIAVTEAVSGPASSAVHGRAGRIREEPPRRCSETGVGSHGGDAGLQFADATRAHAPRRMRDTSLADWLAQWLRMFAKREGRDASTRGGCLANACVALALAAGIAGSWYLHMLDELLPAFLWASYERGAVGGPTTMLSISSLVFYLRQLFHQQTLTVFAAVFLVGLAVFWRHGGRWRWYLVWSILGPYIVFTLIYTKVPKYTVPYLPFVALISAFAVWRIRRIGFRRLVAGFLVCFGLAQYVLFSYYMLEAYEYVRINAPALVSTFPGGYFGLRPLIARHRVERDWEALERLITHLQEYRPEDTPALVMLYSEPERRNHILTNRATVEYYCWREGQRNYYWELDWEPRGMWREQETLPDFLVSVTEIEHMDAFNGLEGYQLLERLQMMDESFVYVYGHRVQPLVEA